MNNIAINLESKKSIFKILREGLNLYLENFVEYTKVMIFPIVAHLIGIPYILFVGFKIPEMFPYETIQQNALLMITATFAATIPGFLLFLAGFWKYLIAMVSLNRYTHGLIIQDKAITMKSCSEYVNNRKQNYVYILCLMMLLWIAGFIMSSLPSLLGFVLPGIVVLLLTVLVSFVSFLMIVCLSVYFSLCFQVFAFEDIGVVNVFKRSFELIENNFWRTFVLLIILYLITGILAPLVIHLLLEISGIVFILSKLIYASVNDFLLKIQNLPVVYSSLSPDAITMILKHFKDPAMEISKSIIVSMIDGIVTSGMLPLGSACFTLLYFDNLHRKQFRESSKNV